MPSYIIPKTSSTSNAMISIFFGKMFQLRDIVHLTHLKQASRNGWEHNALNTLYDEMLDQIDKIVEAYQGVYDIVDIVIPSSRASEDPIQTIKEHYEYFCYNKELCCKDSWFTSEVDVLCTLLAQTLYRLKYTK